MKRNFLLVPIFLMTACLSGCSPQLTAETFTHEAGEELSTDVTEYATFKNPEKAAEATLDLSNVVADKVGTYEATITLKEKEYPFTVEVVDTTAPDGTFKSFIGIVGINDKVTHETFGVVTKDISKVKSGFRNINLLKSADEIKEIFISKVEPGEQFTLQDVFDLKWNEEEDSWEDTGAVFDGVEEFIPEESGLYSMEFISVDEHGNAGTFNCYLLADLEVPVVNEPEDNVIVIDQNMEFEEYMEKMNGIIKAEDNLAGDITYAMNTEIVDYSNKKDGSIEMKIRYSSCDIAGNVTNGETEVIIKQKKEQVTNNQTTHNNDNAQQVQNGFDRARAEQAFAMVNEQRKAAGVHELAWDESLYDYACVRAQEIVNNFAHVRPDGSDPVDVILYQHGAYVAGENIAENYKSLNNLINAWMNSQGHKENVLDSEYSSGVMGCYCHNGSYYYVNLFKG